nr:hypothetical protein Iba_chr15cCG3610 [Ipomoea batatas]
MVKTELVSNENGARQLTNTVEAKLEDEAGDVWQLVRAQKNEAREQKTSRDISMHSLIAALSILQSIDLSLKLESHSEQYTR